MKPEELLFKERADKLKKIINLGFNPYPSKYDKKDNLIDIVNEFSKLKNEEHAKKNVKTAGKIMAIREMGKASFVDIGDDKGIEGTVFRTKRGELSILTKDINILSKSLKPLPDKWYGLKDVDEKL